jgi:hypothetical protein
LAATTTRIGRDPFKWLKKKTKVGSGYPIGTVVWYGPDNRRASKVAVGIVRGPDATVGDMERWFDETGDVRHSRKIAEEIVVFLQAHGVRRVGMLDRIFGCPHEEGLDYPEGESCPKCPYWAGRDRFADK